MMNVKNPRSGGMSFVFAALLVTGCSGAAASASPPSVPTSAAANEPAPASPTLASAADSKTEQHEPFFEKFTLNETSLTGAIHVDAPCENSWKALTQLDMLQKLGPHLHLTTSNGLKSAEKRGDVVDYMVEKPNGKVTGQFVLASPVPFHKVQAVLVPNKGPWLRIQEWVMTPEGEGKCLVSYNESYNQLWLKAAGIEGSGFISKVRDHHMHVILRRGKFLAEGKEPGPPEETAYLFEDARSFPENMRTTPAK
jgi:hypothetical protein